MPDSDIPITRGTLLGAIDDLGFALAVCDRDGRFEWANPAWERLVGRSVAELRALDHFREVVHPSERASVAEHHSRRTQGLPVPEVYDTLFVHADGHPVPIEASVKLLGREDGVHVLAVARDISDRVAAEQQRRRLAEIVETASDGVVSIDADGTIASWNRGAARIFGYDAAEVVGRPIELLDVQPGDVRRQLRRVVEGGESIRDFETLRRRKDGSWVHVSVSAAPLSDGETVVGASAIYRDVSERVRADEERRRRDEAEVAEARALESSRLKSEFLATMSHEIRTPMNGVLGMTGLLLGTELDPEQREYAETVRSSAQTLLTLLDDILDFSKIEAGRLAIEDVGFDVSAVVEEVAELLAAQAHERGLELLVDLDPGLPAEVRGDPSRLRQVLLNLVGNAVKFTERGEVVVRARRHMTAGGAALLAFEVCDTGIGIAARDRERLFDRFTQADTATTRRYGGTGLGLAISRRLVELMGGDIGVESRPGGGSRFWFTVALHVTSAAPEAPPAALAGLHALVVDELAAARAALLTQLGAWGIRAAEAVRAEQALELAMDAAAAGAPFDVLVAGGGVDGVALARAARDRTGAPLPAVLLCAARDRDAAVASADGHPARVVLKPPRRSQLFDALAGALGRAPERPPAAAAPGAAGARPGLGRRVLVVDDVAVNQRLAALVLEKAGYVVDIAADGAAAVDAVARLPYDAVLMDCEMPVMDGYAAARQIRRRETNPGAATRRPIPIVALTASAMHGDAERALAAGMDAHVAKPIDAGALLRTLDELLGDGNGAAATRPEGRPTTVGVLQPGPIDRLVAFDDDFATLLEITGLFGRDAPATVGRLVAAARAGDPETVRLKAHSLAGTAGLVGAVELGRLAERIEAGAREGGVPPAAALERLEALFAATLDALAHEVAARTGRPAAPFAGDARDPAA